MREALHLSVALHLNVRGVQLVPDVSGAIWWPERRTLVASDLHLEKGSAFAARGQLLPPYDSRETLHRLRDAITQYQPTRVVLAGDTFHDRNARARMADETHAEFASVLALGPAFVFIAGNHDPEAAAGLPGVVTDSWVDGGLTIRHEPQYGPQYGPQFMAVHGEIAGHLHPCASLVVRGRRLRRRCFISDGNRLVLPAFGAYAGGLDVFDAAFAPLFPGAFEAFLIGSREIHRLNAKRLLRGAV